MFQKLILKFKPKFKKIFETLVIVNLILYAFYSALFLKAGVSYAQNLPIIKGVRLGELPRQEKAGAQAVGTQELNTIEKNIDLPKKNRFPWGQCTWYVATKRNVYWSGNARNWYYNAKAVGRPVGKTPKIGSIIVLSSGYYGHVGYVEKVDGNVITYSESNNPRLGKITWQTVDYRKLPVIGFIY